MPAVIWSRERTQRRNARATRQQLLDGWLAPRLVAQEGNVGSEPLDSVTAHEHAEERSLADARDRDEILRVREGVHDAFDVLVKRYMARIYTHLYRLVRNREEAEDLTQETFIRVFRFLPQFDAARPFRSWLYSIATNTGLNALRARGRRIRPLAYDEVAEEPHAASQDGRHQVARQELKRQVAEAVTELPARAAMLIHLHYYEGMPLREAGEIAGLSENAAKVALHRARKKLREQLAEEMKP